MQIVDYKISLQSQNYAPRILKVDHSLISIEVELSISPYLDRAKLIFGGGTSFEGKINDNLDIKLGDTDYIAQIFKGKINIINFKGITIEVVAFKPEYILHYLRSNKTFQEQSSGDIVKYLLGLAKIQTGKIDKGIKFPYYYISFKNTFYEIIKKLAEQNNFLYYMDKDNKFVFCKPIKKSIKKTFSYKELLYLSYEEKEIANKGFIVYGESPINLNNKKYISWLDKNFEDYKYMINGKNSVIIEDFSLRNKNAITQRANFEKDKYNQKKIIGEIKVLGNTYIEIGDCIKLKETPSEKINKNIYIVTYINHLYHYEKGFLSTFRFFSL